MRYAKQAKHGSYARVKLWIPEKVVRNVYRIQAEFDIEFEQAIMTAINLIAVQIRLKHSTPTELQQKQMRQKIERNTPASIGDVINKRFKI